MSEGIPIERFEDYIDEVILERGENYARSDSVHIIKRTKNQIIAQVHGTEMYEARLRLEGRELLTYECTCPFEYGPICKHITAVLYIIRDGADLRERTPSIETSQETSNSANYLAKAIRELAHEDLKYLVRKWTSDYMKLEDEFIDFYKEKLIGKK